MFQFGDKPAAGAQQLFRGAMAQKMRRNDLTNLPIAASVQPTYARIALAVTAVNAANLF